MEAASPYQPPASTPPPMPSGGIREPSAVRVFGIFHLILAGLGVLFGFWSFFAEQTNSMFVSSGSAEYQTQMSYLDEIQWVSIMTGIFLLALAAMLFISGIKLVRSQPDGISWSHRYAWTSIATKAISLVVTVIVVMPAVNRMVGGMLPPSSAMPPGEAEKFSSLMKTFMSVSMVATPVISCIYPALALYFLSRPQVKAWGDQLRRGGV